MCRRVQGKEVTLLAKLQTWERTAALAQYCVWLQCSYHMEAASLPPPIATQIKDGSCILECLFFLLHRRTTHHCHLWSRRNTVIPLGGLLAQIIRIKDPKKKLKKMFKLGDAAMGSCSNLSLGDWSLIFKTLSFVCTLKTNWFHCLLSWTTAQTLKYCQVRGHTCFELYYLQSADILLHAYKETGRVQKLNLKYTWESLPIYLHIKLFLLRM